jgi:hypothetical protein
MPETVSVIRVFVSSPGDVAEERAVLDEVVAAINRTDGRRQGFRLELFKWEEAVTPRIGPKPQQVIDEQTPLYDIYLGIMSTRFGTPTGRYGSGTEGEFRQALEDWEKAGAPWITFYFNSQTQLTGDPEQAEQYLKVCQFRAELQEQGIVATYVGVRGSVDGFFEQVSNHLRMIVRRFLAPQDAEAVGTPDKPTVPPEYTEWLLGRCGDVELMGLELKHGSGVRLNHVYTPLATSAQLDETKRGKRGLDEEMMREEQESRQLLLALLNEQSLYVSGDPGSGKSTFCRWVTWLTCNGEMPTVDVPPPDQYQETFPDQLRRRLPVLVRLRDFWQHLPPSGVRTVAVGSLEHALGLWLADQRYPGMDWACLKGHLEHGSALLMLDGVDEVPPVRSTNGDQWFPREMLLSGLAEATAHWTKAGNRVLVTSRPYGLSSEQQRKLALSHAPILGLDQELQALLIRRWFVRLKEDRDVGMETADAMIDHLHLVSDLDELAANPLLLTAMCIIYDEGKRLPHDKYVLYDRIVDTVLHKRYPAKERTEPIRGRLAAVALGMHTGEDLGQQRENPEASATQHEIDLLLQAYQQLDGSTDKGLSDTVRAREDLLSESGLLVSRDEGEASFYHLSIQEFLAGERLHLLHVRKWDDLIDLIAERGASRGWRNTLSFLFGCLLAKSSPHVGIQCLHEISKRADNAWPLVIVLGDCLHVLAGREAVIPDELNDYFGKSVLRAIEQEIEVRDRNTLAVALGRFGDSRIETDLRLSSHPDDHAGYVRIPEGNYYVGDEKKAIAIDEPYWLSKYPVTNSQYALFVDDGGYSREEFWSAEGWQWVQSEGINAPAPVFWRNPEFNAPNQPVVTVSWWEAEAFCKWAGVRLPKADEAEAAARGSQGLKYPWGDEWEDGICNSAEAGLGGTSSVGIFPRDRSPFGVMDVAGNVLEWCDDLWESGATLRVVRGGSWYRLAWYCRAADRDRDEPEDRYLNLGFRVAADAPGKGKQEQVKRNEAYGRVVSFATATDSPRWCRQLGVLPAGINQLVSASLRINLNTVSAPIGSRHTPVAKSLACNTSRN